MYFKGNGKPVSELKDELRMNESIIRGIVVVANPHAIFQPTSHPEQVAEIEEPETVEEPEAAPVAEEPAPEMSESETETPSETIPGEPEAEATEAEPESDD